MIRYRPRFVTGIHSTVPYSVRTEDPQSPQTSSWPTNRLPIGPPSATDRHASDVAVHGAQNG
jgi:hypothetical protein